MTRVPTTVDPGARQLGRVLRTLTEDERSARASALADAKVRDVEERRLAEEEEASGRNSKEGIEQAEREAAEARRKAEEDRHRQDEEAKRKAELEAKKRFGEAEAKAEPWLAPRCRSRGRPASPPTSPTRMKARDRTVAAPAALSAPRRPPRRPPSGAGETARTPERWSPRSCR